ncbi:AcrR family transcriptional regulator [Clavibacter sp. B3I6]|uniref:TetR/AcrR family transcriptional regulator n=1 Tax=Clavibacter sp. B3I6 TaxID=3042268 RepID=UPI002782ACF1|nr:TetR/AcrR family transcriptional regulator [Clavibacter sp. B3I6]MDQ0745497.1 AcrR family transcriptional regulator [Clavibacter sp. B3I6]
MAAPDPHRRDDLLAHILDHLRTHPLQSVTFRGLADALGESTFVLVYHFGSKERLLEAAMDAIDQRQAEMVEGDPRAIRSDQLREWATRAWSWRLTDVNRDFQRLEFEAALLRSRDGVVRPHAIASVTAWRRFGLEWMLAHGVPEDVAVDTADLLQAGSYGLQFDFVISGDRDRAMRGFEALIDAFTPRIEPWLDLAAAEAAAAAAAAASGAPEGPPAA